MMQQHLDDLPDWAVLVVELVVIALIWFASEAMMR